MTEQQIVFGQLAAVEEKSISLQLGRSGEVKIYPRRELDISLEWIFDNMGRRVMCMLRDGVVTEVKTLA